MAGRVATGSEGYTLIELIIATLLSVVIMMASLAFAITSVQSSEADALREEVFRNARFIGLSLQRDAQTVGAGMSSDVKLGTVSTFNDTLVMLHVPWLPSEPGIYEISPPAGTDNPLPAGGTCGTYCIDFEKAADGTFDLEPGDLARLQIGSVRRLILVTLVVPTGSTAAVTFASDTTLLHFQAGFAGGVLLDRYITTVQKIQPIIYWVDDEILYRSDQFESTGDLIASPMAYAVTEWDTQMVFLDGDEADEADPNDTDTTNDFDDILGMKVTATLGANHVHARLAGGKLFTRDYLWRNYPRNLMYERNR